MSRSEDINCIGDSSLVNEHVSLLKLLVRLKQITQQLQERYTAVSQVDSFPIAFFAKAGCFNESDAVNAIAKELHLPVYEIGRSNQNELLRLLDKPQLNGIPLEQWKNARCCPIEVGDGEVLICMADPLHTDVSTNLEFLLQSKVRVAVGKESQIQQLLNLKSLNKDGLDFGNLLQGGEKLQLKRNELELSGGPAATESSIEESDLTEPTVVRLVNKVFGLAVRNNASDIHICPEQDKLVIKIRVDGITRPLFDVPNHLAASMISRIKILAGMDISDKRLPLDGRLRLRTPLGVRDLRVSTIPTAFGEDLVARVLSPELQDISFDSLGMPADIQALFGQALRASSKVNLVAGPTGSGKTSTLYAAIQMLCDGRRRIITIEDPIEYRFVGISQIQVNTKIDMTFAKALRSVLRQDPDIILVGEVRDGETADTVMQTAQTGHLVLSTIHTNSAAAAITRLRDLGTPSFLIASSLQSVLSQRLVRRLCPDCSKPLSCSETYQKLDIDTSRVREAGGCEECAHTGFRGRIGIYSFLDVSPVVAEAIRKECSEMELEQIASTNGFQTLTQAGLELVAAGTTSLQELERVLGPLMSKPSQRVSQILRRHKLDQEEPTAVKDVSSIAVEEAKEQIVKRRILIVDDDDDIRNVYRAMLSYHMFDVMQAADGHEALELIYGTTPPELILCDLMMPKMSGFELLKRLRDEPQTRNIPVLMLTAASTAENELQSITGGADDFVSKTARPEIIIARVNKLINQLNR